MDLFRLGVSVFGSYVSTDLETTSDAWLPYDLKGRPQPDVHAANAPRLAAALRDLSEALDTETDPDDPTWFAKPNETGAENYFDPDGTARDVWGSFEVPYRYGKFEQTPGFGRVGYRHTADGEVTAVPVRGERGLLGHLWASDEDGGAGFEPHDIEDDAVYRAGLAWLGRLRAAHDRGLRPSAGLAELSALQDTEESGRVDPTVPPRTVSLSELRASRSAGGPVDAVGLDLRGPAFSGGPASRGPWSYVMRRTSVRSRAGNVESDCSGRAVGVRVAADPRVEGATAGRRNAGHP